MDVLKLFLENPQVKYHIREVARLLKISPMTARKELIKLSKKGLLTAKKERMYIVYSADTESEEFRLNAMFYMIKKLHNTGVLSCIEIELKPEAIVLFGSVAKGEYSPKSDIDIFVISEIKKKINLEKFEIKLGRKIQLFIYTYKEFESMKSRNKELLNNILNGIVLSGHLEVFK